MQNLLVSTWRMGYSSSGPPTGEHHQCLLMEGPGSQSMDALLLDIDHLFGTASLWTTTKIVAMKLGLGF